MNKSVKLVIVGATVIIVLLLSGFAAYLGAEHRSAESADASPTYLEVPDEQGYADSLMEVNSTLFGNTVRDDLIDAGYEVCNNIESYGMENTMEFYAQQDADAREMTVWIIPAATAYLCQQYDDDLDNYLENN